MDPPPTFPLDLERDIFETTALVHPSTIPGLLRVARRIHIWIEPFLYRVVQVGKDPPYSAMGSAILRATKSKPASFFHNAVRHLVLVISATWTFQEAVEVLKVCTGLEGFASEGDFLDPTLLPILEKLPLRRLSTDLYRLFDGYESIDLTHPLFTSLTNLEILDPIYDDDTRIIAYLPALPALTHLRLSDNVPWKHVETLLADCPRLEVLISSFPAMKAPWAKPPEKLGGLPGSPEHLVVGHGLRFRQAKRSCSSYAILLLDAEEYLLKPSLASGCLLNPPSSASQ
ncbi:hypothetical protein FB451DRAFT_1437844 [Mycena latifolia]|nr:hypothetical protein FB451DRAFT_1437844 [Mycena latifolia]